MAFSYSPYRLPPLFIVNIFICIRFIRFIFNCYFCQSKKMIFFCFSISSICISYLGVLFSFIKTYINIKSDIPLTELSCLFLRIFLYISLIILFYKADYDIDSNDITRAKESEREKISMVIELNN